MRKAKGLAAIAVLLLLAAIAVLWNPSVNGENGRVQTLKARSLVVKVSRGSGEHPTVLNIPAAVKPARVLAQYGLTDGKYWSDALLDFGTPVVGAPLPGEVVSVGRGHVAVKTEGRLTLKYSGFVGVFVGPGEAVTPGDPLGVAEGPVSLRAERGGRAVDPVALLWPEMSRFSDEATLVERERKKLAEEIRRWLAERERKLAENSLKYDRIATGELRVPENIKQLIEAAARETGLDPALLAAVASVESGFNPKAVSPKGAMGVMQLIPTTARSLGVSDPFDPAQNIRAGARYLRSLLDRFGDLELALAAYNAGPNAVEAYGGVPPYPETLSYVRVVLERYSGKGVV